MSRAGKGLHLLDNPAYLGESGDAGRSHTEKKFSLEAMAAQYRGLYREILEHFATR